MTSIQITLTPQAQKIAANLQALPSAALTVIAAAMTKEDVFTVAHIQKERLTGQGPFPVEEHKLGVRTNRLRGSLVSTPARIEGDLVISSIGSNVKYAALHEFGGRIRIPSRTTTVRHRTDSRGALVRQLGNPNLAIFAKAKHKRARETAVTIPAHEIEMPERAPVRTGIADRAANYSKSISAAIIAAIKP
jgi:phage gpG-like protein